ncbi:class I SAM-dependent methyltransferase [Micromonospora sp. NPDC048835]|uniref:class I SAM-dependent methyltransferase n=1 Tax=Micromonospora sp. NPDC048835 TaxID=3155147 RepID=UPI0033F1034F
MAWPRSTSNKPEKVNGQWLDSARRYADLTTDLSRDSEYLRREGLVPTMISLIGPTTDKIVLDAGCGTGWLFDTIDAAEAWECDLQVPSTRPAHVTSSREDVTDLRYPDNYFDVVVSSLVLMWVSDFSAALTEAFRVTRPGGRLVVSLVHPYFNHAGQVCGNGFLIDRDLSVEAEWDDYYISGVVGPLTYYYRLPEQYYNAAVKAGWRLVNFRDWFVDIAHYRREAAGRKAHILRTGMVPTFTFFVAEKAT